MAALSRSPLIESIERAAHELVGMRVLFMLRGQDRFNIYCAPCHGYDGVGRGTEAVRAEELEEPGMLEEFEKPVEPGELEEPGSIDSRKIDDFSDFGDTGETDEEPTRDSSSPMLGKPGQSKKFMYILISIVAILVLGGTILLKLPSLLNDEPPETEAKPATVQEKKVEPRKKKPKAPPPKPAQDLTLDPEALKKAMAYFNKGNMAQCLSSSVPNQ